MATDFEKFARSQRVNIPGLHTYQGAISNLPKSYLSPNILEERELNVTQMDVFSRLMMDRIIVLGTEINAAVSNIIQAQLLYLQTSDPGQDIKIYLNTPGGSVIDGMGIYDTMQYVECDVSTICTGMAASMGAVLLVAGANGKRFALPHSRVMIHQPLGGMQGQAADMEIEYKLIMQLRDELYHIMADHSGKDFETILKDCDRDHWMTAQEALDYGMIDRIMSRQSND